MQDQFRLDWESGGSKFQTSISLRDYIDVRMKHRPRIGDKTQNYDRRKKVRKLTLPYYNGSGKTSTKAWVQKVDNYFQLNLILEEEAIKYAAIHLDVIPHDWWHH